MNSAVTKINYFYCLDSSRLTQTVRKPAKIAFCP